MKNTLNFVRGAVAEKDLVPVLTHFNIKDGRIQGSNGRIAIDAPAEGAISGMNITVPADKFLKAVDACAGEPALKVTEAGNLVIKKGAFRAVLPLAKQEDFPSMEKIMGKQYSAENILPVLRNLRPFISQDASRVWSCGVLLSGGTATATNNVVLVQSPCAVQERINIPVYAVDELLRINIEPVSMTVGSRAVMFEFPDSAWMTAQLFEENWPDVDSMFVDTDVAIPAGVKEAVERVLPFCPDKKHPVINFNKEGVGTNAGDMSALQAMEGLSEASFRAEPLLLVLNVATHMDFSQYPSPCPFKGDGIKGIIAGVLK